MKRWAGPLKPLSCRIVSHGHWRLKGLPQPLELFEAGTQGAPFTPPPDAEKAYRVVQRGEVWLPARELHHSVPAERDAFVGRNAALQELARRYESGARLVSLVGIGGCGKTRLATRFGWAWLGEHPGGTWYCDLAPARTVEGLCSAVAQGLQIPLGGEDALLQLGHAIAARGPCLMILDNFEQLARLAESTLGHWLERAPEARFLVTTREVLGIAGEEALALAPLPMAEARALFLRRAAAARHDFNPGAEDPGGDRAASLTCTSNRVCAAACKVGSAHGLSWVSWMWMHAARRSSKFPGKADDGASHCCSTPLRLWAPDRGPRAL